MRTISVHDKSPIELVRDLIRDTTNSRVYREEFERRIGKDRFNISVNDLADLLSASPIQDVPDQVSPSRPHFSMFHADGSFKPFPREDFSVPGAWEIAEAILSTPWEGCYTKTQSPVDSLKTLRRVVDKKLVKDDDFDSFAHANLFRVIVGEFNKWASKNVSKHSS